MRDLILHGEYVFDMPIITARPHLVAIRRVLLCRKWVLRAFLKSVFAWPDTMVSGHQAELYITPPWVL
jgi:hypothetical protein